MTTARFLFDDQVGKAVLAATSEAADDVGQFLGASNLQLADLGSLWRATGDTAETVTATWQSPVTIDTLGLIGHQLTQQAEYDLALYSDTAGASLVHASSGLVWPQVYGLGQATMAGRTVAGLPVLTDADEWPPWRVLNIAATACRRLELTLRDPTNPRGYVQSGKLMGGQSYQVTYNFEWGSALAYEDDDEVVDMGRGAVWTRRGVSWRRLRLRFADLTHAEGDGVFADFMRRNRTSTPFLLQPDTAGGIKEWRGTVYGVLKARPERTTRDARNMGLPLDVREIVA